MKHPNYKIITSTDEYILIQDIGPWDTFPTVTNRVEEVVEELAERLNGRRLFYIDSDSETDEILHTAGKFTGFKSVRDIVAGFGIL